MYQVSYKCLNVPVFPPLRSSHGWGNSKAEASGLEQCFSNLSVHWDHVGDIIKCVF